MVDASLSISASRPQGTAPRAASPASPFAGALPVEASPAAAASSPALLPGAGAGAASPAAGSPAAGALAIAPVVVAAKPAAPPPSAFHVLLSELNPLQYVPVVGTIYRAVTGDTIPEAARFAGGLVVSGLTGGPVGLAMNVGATLLEHLVGIDPEKIGDRLLAELGIGHAAPAHAPAALASAAPPVAASTHAVASASTPDAATAAPSAKAWSPAQLAAYGVTGGAGGTLRRGSVSGADVLNSLELARIAAPAEA